MDYLQNEITNYHPQLYDSKNSIDLSSTSAQQETDDVESEYEEPSVLMISSDNDDPTGEEMASDASAPENPSVAAEEIDIESSGDGEEPEPHLKTTFLPIPIETEPQTSMSSHLQRLSQLIQSMSNAQQNNSTTNGKELTANDLNTFLANYNIQAGINPQVQPLFNSQKHVMSSDGKIPADRLREIIRLQHKIQKLNDNNEHLAPIEPIRFEDKVGAAPLREKMNEPLKTIKLNGNGVSAAQIVVNRPEGSVLFSLPNHSPAPSSPELEKNYLSQDTLRAVLDLSKQLIASSSQQQQQGFMQQPVYRPMFYNVPVQDLPFPIITSVGGSVHNDAKQKAEDEPAVPNMQKVASVKGVVDGSSDDRKTVIHNHIPITIQTRKAVKPTKLPSDSEQPIVDSYGEKIETSSKQPDSRLAYPPLSDQQFNPFYQQQLTNPIYQQYQPNSFQQIPQRFAPYYQQIYPENPHLSEYNVNSYVNLNTPAYPTIRPSSSAAAANDYQYPTYVEQTYTPMRRPAQRPPSGQFAPNDQPNLVRHDNSDFGDDIDLDTFDDNSSHEHDSDATDENVTGGLSSLVQRPSLANSNAVSNLESKQTLDQHGPNSRPRPSSSSNTGSGNSSPLLGHHNKNDIVHYGSTYMSYQDYQQTVEPLLSKGGTDTIEVLTCVTGARQPHSSDCAKYFVCNAATQKVLDYTCPSFTAFNRESRFCDAKSYSECKGVDPSKRPAITVAANRRIQLAAQESQTALANAQRVHSDALRNQQLTAELNRQTQILINQRNQAIQQSPIPIPPRRPPISTQPRRPQTTSFATTTTQPPRHKGPLKRIIKCNEPTKVRDSLSVFNYFTCFRGADGKLQALKQTCPGGLVFCERIKVCTLKERC